MIRWKCKFRNWKKCYSNSATHSVLWQESVINITYKQTKLQPAADCALVTSGNSASKARTFSPSYDGIAVPLTGWKWFPIELLPKDIWKSLILHFVQLLNSRTCFGPAFQLTIPVLAGLVSKMKMYGNQIWVRAWGCRHASWLERQMYAEKGIWAINSRTKSDLSSLGAFLSHPIVAIKWETVMVHSAIV